MTRGYLAAVLPWAEKEGHRNNMTFFGCLQGLVHSSHRDFIGPPLLIFCGYLLSGGYVQDSCHFIGRKGG
jgi:hypothetical protein